MQTYNNMGIESGPIGDRRQRVDASSGKVVSSDLQEQTRVRLEKLQALRDLGINPYPDHFDRSHQPLDIRTTPDLLGQDVATAGRLVGIRRMGRTNFAHIQDSSGRIQIHMNPEGVGEEGLEFFNRYFDLGDIVGVRGKPFITRTGEVTVGTESIQMLAKALRPLPDKFHGLTDDEQRYRRRYLELIANPDTRDRFVIRSRVVKNIRNFLDNHGFMEVDTPVLQPDPSGANAEPFVTHHNALDRDLFLRIAPETYLKRLIIGGFDRVYEMGRIFRNENIDPSHLQDFTMLEFYASYWNADRNLGFTEALLRSTVQSALGDNQTVQIGDATIDFSQEWPVVQYKDLVLAHSGIDISQFTSEDELRGEIKRRGIQFEGIDSPGLGKLIDRLYKATTRPHLIQPQFVVGFPKDLSPLARRNDADPRYVDQFQWLVNGWELAKGYSELADPIDQRLRLEEQAKLKDKGDGEAMTVDEDYLSAMMYGMAPNSGVGIGIDRLTAVLTGVENLRETIFFPLLRKS